MRSESIRLMVADDLRLGQPVRTSLPLTDEARETAIDSTYRAWEQMQVLAADRDVDALILNGETLVIAEFSAEAEQSLRDGLRTLVDAGVQVLLHPADHEARSFWRKFLQDDSVLSRHVALLCGTIPVPLAIDSDADENEHAEEPCRVISIQDHTLPGEQVAQSDQTCLTIGIDTRAELSHALPPGIDVHISGASAQWKHRQSASLQQCQCASPQPLSRRQAESDISSGCLLVEIHQDDRVAAERLSTASVRFLNSSLDLSSCSEWEDAALTLQSEMERTAWGELERLRLATWTLSGGDSLSMQLLDGSGIDEFLSCWRQSFPLEDGLQIIHAFQPAVQNLSHWIHSRAAAATKELAEALFQQELTGENERFDRLRADWSPDEHSIALWDRLNPHLRRDQIGRHAEALMSYWLRTSDPENLSHETHSS